MKRYIGCMKNGGKKMGAWGPKLYQDDVAEDIKSQYKELLQKGKTNEEALKRIISLYREEIEDYDDGPVFWMVLADILWDFGRLTEEVKLKALKEIEIGGNLKKWRKEGTIKDYEVRKQELEKLKEKLNTPMPEEKKIAKYRSYKCEWKIGDTFAYKIEGEYAKGTKFEGEYFIIRKVGEGTWYPEHIIPIVYVQLTNNKKIPRNKEELDKLEYIPIARKYDPKIKYTKELIEKLPIIYTMKLINTSKRIIPKKLIYIGNFKNAKTPEDELVEPEQLNIWACSWKNIEKLLIETYKQFMS